MKKTFVSRRFAPLLLAVISSSAFAHTGIGSIDGFAAGFVHPWLGIDHLLAMLAIGLWAVVCGGRCLWLLPGTFLLAMMGGAWLGFSGVEMAGAETGVAFSVLALGLLLALNRTVSAPLSACLTIVFALGHGYVHAAELAGGANVMTYSLGFLSATAMLHVIGMTAGLAGSVVFKSIRNIFAVICALVGAGLLVGV